MENLLKQFCDSTVWGNSFRNNTTFLPEFLPVQNEMSFYKYMHLQVLIAMLSVSKPSYHQIIPSYAFHAHW